MTGLKVFPFIFFIFKIVVTDGQKVPEYSFCADPTCSAPVSLAVTKIQYNSPLDGVLSFRRNVEVKIYSKSSPDQKYWGVEYNGKRGYMPAMYLKETRIYKNKLEHRVPSYTVLNQAPEQEQPAAEEHISTNQVIKEDAVKEELNENLKANISPNSVTPVHEVIDGTTLYPHTFSTVDSSATQSSIQYSDSASTESPTLVVAPKSVNMNIFEEKKTESESKTEELPANNVNENKGAEISAQGSDEENNKIENLVADEQTVKTEQENLSARAENILYQSNTMIPTELKEDENTKQPDALHPEVSNAEIEEGEAPDSSETVETKQPDRVTDSEDVNSQQDSKAIPDTSLETDVEQQSTVTENTLQYTKETLKSANEESHTEKLPAEPARAENSDILQQSETKVEVNLENVPHNINEPLVEPENTTETQNISEKVKQNEEFNKFVDSENSVLETPQEIYTQNKEKPANLNEQNVPSNLVGLYVNSAGSLSLENVENESELNKVPNFEFSTPVSSEPGLFTTTEASVQEIAIPFTDTEPVTENPREFVADVDGTGESPTESNTENSEPVIAESSQNNEANDVEKHEDGTETVSEPGFLTRIYNSIFNYASDVQSDSDVINKEDDGESYSHPVTQDAGIHVHEKPLDKYLNPNYQSPLDGPQKGESCDLNDLNSQCTVKQPAAEEPIVEMDLSLLEFPGNIYTLLLFMSITAVTILVFCLGHYYIEKHRQDGTLISSINALEKKLLVISKENLLLHDELRGTKDKLLTIEDTSFGSNEMVSALKTELEQSNQARSELEDQIVSLEKELENATEAGMELNRMLSEFLSSQSGNENVMEKVEYLQKQLMEQQITINNINSKLNTKNTDYELLQTEYSVATDNIVQLQAELDKMVINLLSVQEEKTKNETDFESQTKKIKENYDVSLKALQSEIESCRDENKSLKNVLDETKRSLQLKSNEYNLLRESMNQVQIIQSNKESLSALLDVSKVKAEVQQLRDEKHTLVEKLSKEKESKLIFEKQVQVVVQEMKILRDKFEEAEKEKVEAQTRLEVLSAYFKEKETQMQKEINEQESLWVQKQGEATSTIERIKWIQEEMQNYKSQNEVLKKEILDQEVSLKSQISMLEKKSHENWVLARQAERRLEETKQEASQLRNRLTIVEKNLNNSTQLADESKNMNRIMSPMEANGDMSISPLHMGNMEAPGSPPLLFSHRDPTSPPMPGLPPFMPPPPPPGVPFLPPPIPGAPPFMPPPPPLFPGDHRPPPLGRMSSPPLHGRYSNDSRAYSPYERDDSPPLPPMYPDDDYRRRTPPPMNRPYSPYKDRDYRGPKPVRNKPRTHKASGLSSGSGNSNESLENSGRQSGRV